MNRTITHLLSIITHLTPSISFPYRPNINQEGPCPLGLCLDDTILWPDTSQLLFPLFYSGAVHFSHIRGFWALSFLRVLRIYQLDEVEERKTTTMGTQDIRLMQCTDTTPTQDPGRAWGVKSSRSSWAHECMLRLLRRNFLVLYPSKPSTCLNFHPIPIPSHPHIPLVGDGPLKCCFAPRGLANTPAS